MQSPRLGVVLVNWRSASDCIECLETLLRSTIPVAAVVVDNGSGDGSLETIEAWAQGLAPFIPPNGPLGQLSTPPLPKPVEYIRAATGESWDARRPVALTLIDSGANLGFAGGNNIGLRYLLAKLGIDHVWLLNNDTVVEPSAAEALLRNMDALHNVGMCGTVVRFYHRPNLTQSLSGFRFNWWTGASVGVGANLGPRDYLEPAKVVAETDYILGASLGVSRAFVAKVGLMNPDYFLYYEEIDWAARNRGRFQNGYARGAIVYHKEGGSIGSSSRKGERGDLSEYYLVRSRLRFIARHAPALLPVHWLVTLGQIAKRLARRQPSKARVIFKALLARPY